MITLVYAPSVTIDPSPCIEEAFYLRKMKYKFKYRLWQGPSDKYDEPVPKYP